MRVLTDAQDDARWGAAARARVAIDMDLPSLSLWNYGPCPAHQVPDPGCQQCGAKFRRHQRTAIMWLYLAKRGLLSDPTGTGKTIIVLGLLAALREAGELGCEPGRSRAVVLTTAGAVGQWAQECQRFIPSGLRAAAMTGDTLDKRVRKYADPWDVLFISPETVRLRQIKRRTGGTSRAGDLEILQQFRPGIVVYDDVDAMRNPDNKTAFAIRRLCEAADRVIGVHATPLQKRLGELHSFLVPLGGAQLLGSRAVFEHQYVRTIASYEEQRDRFGHVIGSRRVIKEVGVKNGPQLKRLIAPLVLRRTPEQIDDLEMPELVCNTVWLEPSREQRERYAELRQGVLRRIRESGDQVSRAQAMAMFTHGWQICSGLATLDGDGAASVKLDWAMDKVLGDMEEEKLVWFINFTPNVQDAARRLTAASVGHVVQWGREASPSVRAQRLERWRADPGCRVLIGTTSIERSLNLQAARHLVAVDTITNPARMAQLAGRVKRAGSQHKTVYLHQLLLRHTQEEAYPALLAREQAVADYVWGEESTGMFASLTPLQLLQLVGDPAVLTAQAA